MAAKSDQALRRVRAATAAQLRACLPDGRPVGTSAGGRDRVRLGRLMFLLTDTLQTLSNPTTRRPASLAAHLRQRARARSVTSGLTRTVVGSDPAAVLEPQARRLLADLELELQADQVPACVESLFGTARLADYLRGVLVDATALALEDDLPTPDASLVECSRTLAAVLHEEHAGSTIELRVPPATAVQLAGLGAGPSHTRGTPPNVVECEPAVFVRLALGFSGWDEVLAGHRLSASGSHAHELAALLPVVPRGEA